MMTTLFGGAPEQAPRWDLMDTESYDGGIRFLAPVLIVWGYVCIYRRKKYASGATGAPRAATDVLLPPIYTYVPRNHQGRP